MNFSTEKVKNVKVLYNILCDIQEWRRRFYYKVSNFQIVKYINCV